jgi:hypothetical protein
MKMSPHQRLRWIARHSWPIRRPIDGRQYAVGLAVLAALVVLIAIGLVVGKGAAGIFRVQADWIRALAAPAGR